MLKSTNKDNGFTIIEVVLVLAIAGLIFLVVFLALPALQKSQRDNARKQDVGKVAAGFQSYMADNGNQTPSRVGDVASTGYWSGLAQATGVYIRPISDGCYKTSRNYTVAIDIGCRCSELGSGTTPVADARYAALDIRLESGSNYCMDV